jgi:hypothetical protein
MSDTRGAILAAALVGGLVFLAPSTPPAQKQSVVAAKSQPAPKVQPVQKTSAPSQRTQPAPRLRPPAAISRPERKAVKKQQKRVAGLPSCASVRAQYDSMSLAQRWSAYRSATSEQVAHGRRCLGI